MTFHRTQRPAPGAGAAGSLAVAFTTGLHAAFYASVAFMVIAAVLSGLRAGRRPRPAGQPPAPAKAPEAGKLKPARPDAVGVGGGGDAEFTGADLLQHHAGDADDGRRHVPQTRRVAGIGDLLRDTGSL
jgi:hypothetical protein